MVPDMNNAYDVVDGKPHLIENPSINLGIAIDIRKGETRQLLVPNIKGCENLNFFQFWSAYEQVVPRPAQANCRSATSPAPPRRSPTRAASAPTTRCRA